MTNQSVFNLDNQNQQVSSKIIVALQRISEAFKTMLWNQAKALGLSPIQIQILIFIAYHKDSLCQVSQLATEFNLKKPTISDAVGTLVQKDYVFKDYSPTDNRRYIIRLTDLGTTTVTKLEALTKPLETSLSSIPENSQSQLFTALSQVIYLLNRQGILMVQRTCFGCTYYSDEHDEHYCNLLKKPLLDTDIRLDCPEFETKA